MPTPSQLTQSIHELSEAIEQLAAVLEQQKSTDNDIHVRQFSLLVKRFSESAQKIDSGRNIASPSAIKEKHQKDFLKNWLAKKRILVADSLENLRADEYLFKTVDFLADHYTHLNDFYKQLKAHQSIKKNFTYNATQQSINYIQKWCGMLRKDKIIDSFSNTGHLSIFVDIAEMHKATNFIYGYWLEVLLRREIAILMNHYLPVIYSFDILSQVNVMKPDTTPTEFDLLLMINQKIFWFECKSGSISSYFEKFREHRLLLNLNEFQSHLVIPHVDAGIAQHTRKRAGMNTLFGTTLETQLRQTIFSIIET